MWKLLILITLLSSFGCSQKRAANADLEQLLDFYKKKYEHYAYATHRKMQLLAAEMGNRPKDTELVLELEYFLTSYQNDSSLESLLRVQTPALYEKLSSQSIPRDCLKQSRLLYRIAEEYATYISIQTHDWDIPNLALLQNENKTRYRAILLSNFEELRLKSDSVPVFYNTFYEPDTLKNTWEIMLNQPLELIQ